MPAYPPAVERARSSNPVDPRALERLREVFRRDKSAVCAQFSEVFYTYPAEVYLHGVPSDMYVRKMEALRRGLEDARVVLDVGAGFGVYACRLRILGIPRAVAMDDRAQKTRDALRNLAAFLVPEGRVWVFEDNTRSAPGYDLFDVWDGAETGGYAAGVPSRTRRATSSSAFIPPRRLSGISSREGPICR